MKIDIMSRGSEHAIRITENGRSPFLLNASGKPEVFFRGRVHDSRVADQLDLTIMALTNWDKMRVVNPVWVSTGDPRTRPGHVR